MMLKEKLAAELASKLAQVMAAGPARDLEKNLRATLTAWLAKLDLVTREEYDVQTQVLARTRQQLAELETRLQRLEQTDGEPQPPVPPPVQPD